MTRMKANGDICALCWHFPRQYTEDSDVNFPICFNWCNSSASIPDPDLDESVVKEPCVLTAQVVSLGATEPIAMAIKINAEDRWNPTGVTARKGVTYRFEVNVLPDQPWKDWFIKSGPGGYTNPIDPFGWWLRVKKVGERQARYFMLIGTIGQTNERAFIIGAGCTYTAEWDGPIYCFANDVPTDLAYGNNRGALELTITEIATPAVP